MEVDGKRQSVCMGEGGMSDLLKAASSQIQKEFDDMFYRSMTTTNSEPFPQEPLTVDKIRDLANSLKDYQTPVFTPCDFLTEIVEDWSGVRSPSRAERRRRQGHKQNIIYKEVPNETVYVFNDHQYIAHPDIIEKIKGPAK